MVRKKLQDVPVLRPAQRKALQSAMDEHARIKRLEAEGRVFRVGAPNEPAVRVTPRPVTGRVQPVTNRGEPPPKVAELAAALGVRASAVRRAKEHGIGEPAISEYLLVLWRRPAQMWKTSAGKFERWLKRRIQPKAPKRLAKNAPWGSRGSPVEKQTPSIRPIREGVSAAAAPRDYVR